MIELPPVPGRIAGLPRDPRGYPVPAENLWLRGKPELAVQDFRRCGALYAHGCCAVCGLPLTPGESLYRLFAQDDAEQTVAQNACKRTDGPGHRDCMIFSGAVCPFFATAGARRGRETRETPKGTPRGTTAALLGFEAVHIAVDQEPPHQVWFHYGGVQEHIAFTGGEEMAALLTETEPPRGPAVIRKYWKTEPEVKRVWAQTLKLARRHGTSMRG
ncbi:hypothetical protein [Streptomyces cavernae]|uniref:hypothetical protein n=1 Tax=Streptomyces cavernae TaxID=2259034 RepID=UPI000FEB90C7|nr:hypothetical protein [Streptomyces cavernae]